MINYFEIDKSELEDILKIFVRVNSGGMPLNKTDLLFSTIVATWEGGRDTIEEFIKSINVKGDGFDFTNEFLMRCCLVLSDAPVLYKVNSFRSENVEKIKNDWNRISKAISQAVDLIVEFGFNGSLLTSQNAIIFIAYYMMHVGKLNDSVKLDFKKYLIHSLLNGIYGSSQDQIITFLRNTIRKEEKQSNGKVTYTYNQSEFSFDALLEYELPSNKSFYIYEGKIDKFLEYKKGASSFFVLSLLYPQLKFNYTTFHQDHIHPFSKFTSEYYSKFGLTKQEIEEWDNKKDMIPNLQLMEGKLNSSKNDTEFKLWLETHDENFINHFKVSNYIPETSDLDFSNFNSFFEQRKEKLKTELKKVLSINSLKNEVDENEIEIDSE